MLFMILNPSKLICIGPVVVVSSATEVFPIPIINAGRHTIQVRQGGIAQAFVGRLLRCSLEL